MSLQELAMGVTSIRLSEDVEVPLEQLAKKLDRSKNYLVNQAIKEFVLRQSMEELRWADTVEALDSVKAARLVDSKEVSEWLKSWGSDSPKSPPQA
jgi:predicted transcriptional regulator